MKHATHLVSATIFVTLASCGGSADSGTRSEEPRVSDPVAEPASEEQDEPRSRPSRGGRGEGSEPQPVDPATVGKIRVSCLFEGEPPKRQEINVSREAACDIHSTPPLTEKVVVSDGKLANVYVRIKSGYNGWIVPLAPEEPVYLEQVGCIYTPHLIAMREGQHLLVKNQDPVTHNVNMRAKRNPSRNQTQARGAPPIDFALERAEDKIPVKCDIHPWMGAWVHVSEHPWFGVSGPDGELVIEGVPPGSYVLEAIHEDLGKERLEIEVEPSGTAEVTFTFED